MSMPSSLMAHTATSGTPCAKEQCIDMPALPSDKAMSLLHVCLDCQAAAHDDTGS